jgi:predicted SnoaL-like aldol condensation-catalyzing enzyme
MRRPRYRTLDVTIEDLIAAEDRAKVRLRWRGTRTSGDDVERETLEIIRIQDGTAVEHWGGRC